MKQFKLIFTFPPVDKQISAARDILLFIYPSTGQTVSPHNTRKGRGRGRGRGPLLRFCAPLVTVHTQTAPLHCCYAIGVAVIINWPNEFFLLLLSVGFANWECYWGPRLPPASLQYAYAWHHWSGCPAPQCVRMGLATTLHWTQWTHRSYKLRI